MHVTPARRHVLPTHPSKVHPHTGAPLQAIWVAPSGRVFWPIIGASPDDEGGDAGGSGGGGGDDGKGDDKGKGNGDGGAGGGRNATDSDGNDLGFPKDTPIQEMTDKEQAAYWRNNARKHEGRVKSLVGDRKPEDVKKDLDAYAELRKAEQTPAEKALTEKFDEGKDAGRTEERRTSATAIFRGSLESGGITGDDLDELVEAFNVDAYIGDDGINTTKITNFAKRFQSGKDDSKDRRRDFGGGKREEREKTRGSAGKAEAERRFKKKSTSGE